MFGATLMGRPALEHAGLRFLVMLDFSAVWGVDSFIGMVVSRCQCLHVVVGVVFLPAVVFVAFGVLATCGML